MNLYMQYTRHTEQPTQFRRWALLSAVNAMLGRRSYFKEGRLKVYPHMYVLLSGLPATRKNTAINAARGIVKLAGYKSFAPTGSSREKFLEDLQTGFMKTELKDAVENGTMFEQMANVSMKESPCYVASGEFIDFIGTNDVPFITTLTNLWDITDDPYEERFRKAASVLIYNPIVNLIGGVTQETLRMAMPTNILGHGFLSRVIMVHSDPVAQRITFPADEDDVLKAEIAMILGRIKQMEGVFKPDAEAAKMLDKIYRYGKPPSDARLQSYFGRRLDHLLKVCIACAACREQYVIDAECVEEANTILRFTEDSMGQALGELGDARNSRATQNIMNILSNATGPVSATDLFNGIMQDIDKFLQFQEIMQNLERVDKVSHTIVDGVQYFLLQRGDGGIGSYGYNPQKWLEEFAE